MSIVPSAEVYDFLDFTEPYFTISAVNNVLILSYNGGADTSLTVSDGTYSGAELAAELETQIDTAFTITSTVSYSSTTYKFTINPGANTIAFTLAGSDAAATFGFTADKAAAASITSDVAVGNDNEIIDDIHTAVEKWVKTSFDRNFESTSHVNERYSSDGKSSLVLRDYPVTAFQKIAIGERDVIRITNTNTYTDASVSVSSTAVILYNDESETASIDFATYTTLAAVIAQINATGSGWSAEIVDSQYSNFKSTQLTPKFGMSTIDDVTVDLSIPDVAETGVTLNETLGIVYFPSVIPPGTLNIAVSYTGGYSASTMPDDLKLAIKIIIQSIYQKRDEEIFHAENYTLGELSVTLQKNIPMEAKKILDTYRRVRI